jgi:hypothetical protein
MIEIDNSDGLDETMRGLVLAVLDTHPNVGAVYSIGGGNMAIVEAFASRQRTYSVFIAHDLDQDNTWAASRWPDFSRAPSRPQTRHASGLLCDHAGAQGATWCRLLLAIEYSHHYAVQHARTGSIPFLRAHP